MDKDKAMVKKRLICFVSITFVVSWIMFGLIPWRGLIYGTKASIFIIMAVMFIPALSSLLTRLITREGFGNLMLRPNFKGHVKDYLLVFFGPTILLLLSVAVYFLIMPGSFDPQLTVLQETAGRIGTMNAPTILLISILQVVIIGPIINIIPTLGEELGWRAYLLPKLRELLSNRAALVVTGIIHALWHTPVILMGHNYGTSYAGCYPWLGLLAMIVFVVWLGIIEGYITIKLNSVIPAAMIHSTINAGAGMAILMAKTGYNPILGPSLLIKSLTVFHNHIPTVLSFDIMPLNFLDEDVLQTWHLNITTQKIHACSAMRLIATLALSDIQDHCGTPPLGDF